jgi:asparagine synthetase B (glutamine-hydrolysing)
VYLSGGIDSSVVFHHAATHTPYVRSYSLNFEVDDVSGIDDVGNDKFNADARLAERTAKMYGSEHTKFTVSIQDVRNELLGVYESLDEPVSDITGTAHHFLNKWVRGSGTVVALGGDGGDELFGGYNRHRRMMGAFYFQKLPHVVQDALIVFYPELMKLRTAFPVDTHLAYMASGRGDISRIIREGVELNPNISSEFFTERYVGVPKGMHPLDAFMRVDRRVWLADLSLALSDRFSMRHGLEFRVPLLDTSVVHTADAF